MIGDDSSGTCEYVVATQPTIAISGGTAPTVATFGRVTCSGLLGFSIFAGEYDVDGRTQTVFASQDGDGAEADDWKVLGAAGTLAELTVREPSEDELTLTILGKGVMHDGAVDVEGANGEVVHLACTPAPALGEGS